jgi:anti-sigma B factor antagonist
MKDTVVDMVVVDSERHITVLLSGELDRATAPGARDRLLELAGSAERPLVLDLGGISFFDAEGMRAVASVARACEQHGLAVVGLRPFAEKMFRILHLHEAIPLCATQQEALWCLLPRTDTEIATWLS